ncbi:MAG: sulfurtransferase [Clostridioides sp.]|jgi:thiosulfate/3-mercaptopyruvate sulfurtransferase|nr:sulfurtransferase [Clostridioides sp.]
MKSQKVLSLILAGIITVSVVGCSNKKEEAPKEETKQETKKEAETKTSDTTRDEYTFDDNDFLTSVTWLNDNLKKEKNLVVIDARADKEYAKGHIPGAINVAWQSLAKVDGKAGDKDWGTLLEGDALTKALSSLGISKDSKVVVYANKDGWGEDGRIVWCLDRAGVQARMLNGGIELWTADKKELSSEATKPTAVEAKFEAIKPDMNITTEDLKKELKDVKIIDVRSEKEYKGATDFGEARGGHLPGAVNVPFATLYNEDGTIKSNEKIAEIMDKTGIKKDDKIVTYCTAGIRSAHMALALKNAGYENVRNYDSSYYEWAADEGNEVEK